MLTLKSCVPNQAEVPENLSLQLNLRQASRPFQYYTRYRATNTVVLAVPLYKILAAA